MSYTFLGFELDTRRMETRLPSHKLEELHQEVQRWAGRKSATRKELESVVGKLAHASRVVRPREKHFCGTYSSSYQGFARLTIMSAWGL